MITKQIKDAVKEIVAARIDRANYGMTSRQTAGVYAYNTLHVNGITITSNMSVRDYIQQNGKNIGEVQYKYASQKRNGMYKMLRPTITYYS